MVSLSAIGKITAASGLISLAGQMIAGKGPIWDIYRGIMDSSASDKGHQLWDMIKRADRTNATLAQYTSQMRITTRAFIDSTVAEEPVTPNLLKALRGWYIAQVLTALRMNTLITKEISIQDVLGVVQTGESAHYENAGLSALKRFAGLTSLMQTYDEAKFANLSSEAYDFATAGASGAYSGNISPAVEAAIKKVMGNLAKKDSSKNWTQSDTFVKNMGAQVQDAVKIAASSPNPQSSIGRVWQVMSDAYAKTNNDVIGKVLASAVAAAGVAYVKQGMTKMLDARAGRVNEKDLQEAKNELAMAQTKEQLTNIADQFHLDRRLIDQQLDQLWAPIDLNPERYDLEKINGIAQGELITVQMNVPGHPTASVPVPIFIQMLPINVPYQVAPRFIDRMTSPSVWQRWTMMTAGEIEFFRDFIGQYDRLKQRISQTDPESLRAFKLFLNTIQKKDNYSLGDVASKRAEGNMSQNLANSVMVFSEDTVRQAYAESGIDLHNDEDRKRYFNATYTMIIAIVDPNFAEVNVYINGIDGKINFKYSALKPADKKFDPVDLISAMSAMADGKAPSLR